MDPIASGAAVIRDATTRADLDDVRSMLREYEHSLGVDLCFQGFDKEVASLPGDYARPHGCLLIATTEERPVGVVALRHASDTDGEMKRLFVRPAGRGAGLGRRLAEAVIVEARRAGYQRLLLDTLPLMTEARALYATLGFAEIAPYRANPVAGVTYLALDLSRG